MANQDLALKTYIEKPVISDGIIKTLGKKNAQALKSALLTLWSSNDLIQKCSPKSIVGAAMCAASNGLSVSPQLGHAYIVPYRDRDGNYQAQFQIGAKGLTQLALRTGRYKTLYSGKIFEGEIRGRNPFTGEFVQGERISDKVVGYIAYMKLVDGFEGYLYMTVDELEDHAAQFSQSFKNDKKKGWKSSVWTTNFDAMAQKTVLKRLLLKFGILSTEAAEIIHADQSVVDKDSFTYVDNGGFSQPRSIYIPDGDVSDSTLDSDTGEIVPAEATDVEATVGNDSVPADKDPF